MKHILKISSSGKVVDRKLQVIGIDYGITDVVVCPDANDPSLLRISYNITLQYPANYIYLTLDV